MACLFISARLYVKQALNNVAILENAYYRKLLNLCFGELRRNSERVLRVFT